MLFICWGFAGGVFGVGIRAAGTEGYAFGLDRGDWLGCQFDFWIVKTVEPEGVENTTFAADAVVWGKDLVVFFGHSFLHMADQVGLCLFACFCCDLFVGEQ